MQMSQPAKRNQKQRVYNAQKRQAICLLFVVAVVAVCEAMVGMTDRLITKSVATGALLNFIAQSTFTLMAYRATGAKLRQQIMLNMYFGQVLKWLITLIGFAMIFIYAKPINAAVVVLGYLIMQLSHSLVMLKIR